MPNASSSPLVAGGRWSAGNQSRWVGNHAKSVAFELEAGNRIAAWMNSVRPVLVVRCLDGKTDAFVFTETAARIEPQDDNHTVALAFGAESAVTERWPDSENHDALFAPNGETFARRLATERVLRFGFTPHNAPPVTASFDLAGVDTAVRAVGAACKWK